MSYQVVWPRCNVFDSKGQPTTLGRGDFLPDGLDEVQVSQLATIGAVQFVDQQQDEPRPARSSAKKSE